MKILKKKFDWYHILLTCIIIAQMLFVSYMFNEHKMGYHSDEIFNYGFANSYDRKEIYIDDSGENIYDKWLPSTVFNNYITVQEGEQFAYDKVYKHAAEDLNPPFQLFVLHTICSFFPNVYSKWFCFTINIVSLGISLVYINKSVETITKSKVAAIGAVILYGFGAGAQSVTVFLRLYALGVMLASAFFYYSVAIYSSINDEKAKNKYYIGLAISLLLGAFTLHYFLPFSFAIVLCYSIIYFLKKKYRIMLQYGFTCLGAVVMSFVIFPSTFSHLFASSTNLGGTMYGYPFDLQVRLFFHYSLKDLLGLETDIFRNPNLIMPLLCIVFVIALLFPICFLLRKEKWFIRFAEYVKRKVCIAREVARNFDYSILVAFAVVIFIIIVSARSTSFYRMGGYTVRYMFIVYPVIVVCVSSFIAFIIGLLIQKKVIKSIAYLLVIGLLLTLSLYNNAYMFYIIHNESGVTLKDIEPRANTIILLSEHWMASTIAPEMGNKEGYFFISSIKDLENKEYRTDNDEPIYIIVDTSYVDDIRGELNKDYGNDGGDSYSDINSFIVPTQEEVISVFENYFGTTNINQVGYDEVFGRTFEIYRVE